ncbi:hematopoietic prostaglandin D synthase-like [Ostrea edulis]|uniref:hematopoietic prostaglandin D synthase-like n=1 Tax=Ostrea edulis TaxID=37623 RepID=UPI0020954513|nr:hematopoietic prostaglandin D synthase-like [Ostrea edulis]
MTKYTLHYFNLKGRGEIVRLMLVAAGVDFEDHRVEREEWPKLKPTMPAGQMPVLEVDGKKYCQSLAIARYVAREYGMAGASSTEQLLIDQVVDTVNDLLTDMVKPIFEQDATRKAEMMKKLNEETVPRVMGILLNFLEGNGGQYFVGTKLSLADVYFMDVVSRILDQDSKILDKFPKLAANLKSTQSLPKIADYLAKRPKTEI